MKVSKYVKQTILFFSLVLFFCGKSFSQKAAIPDNADFWSDYPVEELADFLISKMTDEELLNDMQGSFKHKFAKKPEVIEGNMKALEMALKEVNKI